MDVITYAKAQEALEKAQEARDILDSLNIEGGYIESNLKTPSTNMYLATDSFVRVTDKEGYNDGDITYQHLQAQSLTLKSNDGNKSAHLKMDDNDGGRLKIDVGSAEIWVDPSTKNIYFRADGKNQHTFFNGGKVSHND